VQRLQAGVSVTVWPTPDTAQSYYLVYWYLRRIYDAGPTAAQTTDVPYRFLEALTAGLAFKVAQKLSEGQARLMALKQEYMDVFQAAIDEDREKAPVRFIPRIGML
jgi:hypothetical protein